MGHSTITHHLTYMKKYKTTIILVLVLTLNVLVIIGIRHWRAQKQQQVAEMIRHAERYSGATGPTITIHDERTDRWIAEMKEEPIEVVLQKLTDAAEHITPGFGLINPVGTTILWDDKRRDETVFRRDIEALLSNRRFRKAYEDVQKTDKKRAAELLIKNINDNLTELHTELQKDKDVILRGDIKGDRVTVMWNDTGNTYRPMSHPDLPPTRIGRRYAILSYIMLASFFEIQDVRPAIEDVVQFAKEEYKLFNSIDDEEADAFKSSLLEESLYNPSLLITAALCDPTWNADKHKRLEAKLVNDKVVDWQARSLEHDMPGREGWVPIVPHGDKIKIRYYRGITDAEFNDFFGK